MVYLFICVTHPRLPDFSDVYNLFTPVADTIWVSLSRNVVVAVVKIVVSVG